MSCPDCQQSGPRSRKALWFALAAVLVVGAIGAAELVGGGRRGVKPAAPTSGESGERRAK